MNDSSAILDHPGAEHLIGRGDMLYSSYFDPFTRIQCCFADTEEITNGCNWVKKSVRKTVKNHEKS